MQGANDLSNARHLTYLDFELEIGLGSGREYPIVVVRSPAGEARETLRFPFDELALESRLKDLQIALLCSGGKRRQMLSPEERAVQEFGRTLFDSLVVGEVRSRYDVSQRDAARQGKWLRLKLRIQPPELAALPWEYLYDSRQAEYVCLSRNTPVVRYLELPQPILPLTVTPPLRILGMVASPNDLPLLDVAREKQRVENAIQALRANGLVELTWLVGQTWRDLQRAMRMGPWHVFHFVGHGGYDRQTEEGCIALADEEGQASRLSATQLGRLLADHRSLRMVLLNACEGARGSERDIFSSAAAILVRRGIPAVLAMQYEITDQAAIEFARTFYEALTDEMPVDEAVTEARKAISMMVANTVEWGTPVLYMRSPDGVLFGIPTRQAERERKAAERRVRQEAARQEQERLKCAQAAQEEAEHKAREEAVRRKAEQQAKLALEKAEKAARQFKVAVASAWDWLRRLPWYVGVAAIVLLLLVGVWVTLPSIKGVLPTPTVTTAAVSMQSSSILLPTATPTSLLTLVATPKLMDTPTPTVTPTPSVADTPTPTVTPTPSGVDTPTPISSAAKTITPTPIKSIPVTVRPTSNLGQALASSTYVRNFRAYSISDAESLVTFDYSYNGDHGDRILLSAQPTRIGGSASYMFQGGLYITRGSGTASIRLRCYKYTYGERCGGWTTDSVWVNMLVAWGQPAFYTSRFDYVKTWAELDQ